MTPIRQERRKGTRRDWIPRTMRLPLIIAALSCTFAQAEQPKSTASQKPRISSKDAGLRLDIQGGGWGSARKEAIETVLYAVADELLSRVPNKLNAPIVVTHSENGPIALYDRGPNGEYQVQLHAKGENWHLYAYEFAHEFCHILSNHDENVGPETQKYNQWFEETLCETASLYTLKSLAATWEDTPPSPLWREAARKMHRYFDHLLAEGHRQLPAHTPLQRWLADNEDRLRNDPYRREDNEVVANLLLPLFQDNPQNWDALAYLNLNPDDARTSLRDYLRHWYDNAPYQHKRFIGGILSLLRLDDAAPLGRPALASQSLGEKASR